jgi:transcriptional regulator GlxA family with amidase domain
MKLPDRYRRWHQVDIGQEALESARFRVGILLLPQASMANVFSVLEDLAAVNNLPGADQSKPSFAARIIAEEPGPFRSISGGFLMPHGTLGDFGLFDAIVLPTLYDDGYLSIAEREPILTAAQREWLHAQHNAGATFSTMCSGVFPLAESGLLKTSAVAMHPLYAATFAHRFPSIPAVTRRSLVVSGQRDEFISGGYSTYSADVSLYLIARFLGPEAALSFAKLYQKDWNAALQVGDTSQPHENQNQSPDMTVRLAQRYMLDHLSAPSLVSAAAALAHLDERTFSRRFKRATGLRPSDYVFRQRMRRAQDLLVRCRMPIEEIATRVGYYDRSSFSKAFKVHANQSPAQYRKQNQLPLRLFESDLNPGSS